MIAMALPPTFTVTFSMTSPVTFAMTFVVASATTVAPTAMTAFAERTTPGVDEFSEHLDETALLVLVEGGEQVLAILYATTLHGSRLFLPRLGQLDGHRAAVIGVGHA